MLDYFEFLGESRLPLPDDASLKSKFLKLSTECHPDRFHSKPPQEREMVNQKYAEINAAYNCLRDPKERLLHLYTLENGSKPKDIQRIPPGTMDLFIEVGQICQNVDVFLVERAKVTSPMLKVKMFEQGMEWTDKLNEVQQKVRSREKQLISELEAMNQIWASAPAIGKPERAAALPLERLEQIYRIFSYITRWLGQIQERIGQLAV